MTTPIPAPPVGARVRHTTRYTDHTAVIIEGTVTESQRDNGIHIGDRDSAHWCALGDKPGVYTVAVEVLEQPLPAEPIDGYYLDRDGDIWARRDFGSDERHWSGSGEIVTWQELNRKWGPLTRLVADPADTAPDLPWACIDEDGDRLRIMPLTGKRIAVDVTQSGHSRSAHITPDDAETAARALLRAAREARQP